MHAGLKQNIQFELDKCKDLHTIQTIVNIRKKP